MGTDMSFKEELALFRTQIAENASPERLARVERDIATLRNSGLRDTMLKAGQTAPPITLQNAKGELFDVATLLSDGPVVLTFYRGGWCPFCNLALKALQKSLPEITDLGANLVAISPEVPDETLSTREKNGLTFEVLSDVGQEVGRAFGLVYELSDEIKDYYTSVGLDLPSRNGTVNEWHLLVPATYVIDRNGVIAFAFAEMDYRDRVDPSDIVRVLRLINERDNRDTKSSGRSELSSADK